MRSLRFVKLVCAVGLVLSMAGCAMFNAPPTAQFTWSPSNPVSLHDIQFTDLSTDTGGIFGGGGIVAWLWDFGDSGSSSTQNPKHAYAKGGTYTVKLTVTDDGGEMATFSRQIDVTPSLQGTWNGSILDVAFFPWPLTFVLSHSPTGSISGQVSIGLNSEMLTAGSFNPNTREVVLTAGVGFFLTFRGTLDASESRIEGKWYDSITGQQGEDFWVNR